MGVRDKAARNGAPHAQRLHFALQQARDAKTCDWICHRHWLTPEDPACHREPQGRIAQMKQFHGSNPPSAIRYVPLGRRPDHPHAANVDYKAKLASSYRRVNARSCHRHSTKVTGGNMENHRPVARGGAPGFVTAAGTTGFPRNGPPGGTWQSIGSQR